MNHETFWALIDEARRADGVTSAALETKLARLSAGDIEGFYGWLAAYLEGLRREDLWAAVYTLRGGCGDDAFDYFRGWLVGRGEAAVLDAVKDPESLADLVGERDPRDERMLSVAQRAYRVVVGGEMPPVEVMAVPGPAWPADRIPAGVKWTDLVLKEHFPKLHARFGSGAAPSGAISHERFWALIAKARGRKTNTGAIVDSLDNLLEALPADEIIGFASWLHAYNQALFRNDLRVACRLLLFEDDVETFLGFRGWLLAQGYDVLCTALTDLDALAACAKDRVTLCKEMVFVTMRPLERAGHYGMTKGPPCTIPGRESWSVDLDDTPSLRITSQMRARYPRLAARGDAEALARPDYERDEIRRVLTAQARTVAEGGDDREALEILGRALSLGTTSPFVNTERARLLVRLGEPDAAMRELDAALSLDKFAAPTLLERAKLLLARGERSRALDDATEAARCGLGAANEWLAKHARPKRVRHAKFGEGVVVAVEENGKDQKQLLASFVEIIE